MTGEIAGTGSGRFRRLTAWANRHDVSRRFAIGLTVAALISGLLTYAALTGSIGARAETILILLNINLVLFLLLFAVVARRLVSMWNERRRGAGSRLHARLVLLFSLIAITPAIIVSVFSAVFFSFGMQQWFSDRVRTAIVESRAVAEAYLKEHRQVMEGDVLAMARDLNRISPHYWSNPRILARIIRDQGIVRNLSEVYVFDGSGRVLARWNLSYILDHDSVSLASLEQARAGKLVLLTSETDDRLRAVIKLDGFVERFLYVGRYVEPRVLEHIEKTKRAVARYEDLEGQRYSIEISFAMMFVLVALLLLMAAVWLGLTFATRLARPITGLADAAERVRAGDLSVRVTEPESGDEIGLLSRAFNRMTDQLEAQRNELIETNRQLEIRRHFMESVLTGVSAGVIGLDAAGRINLPNGPASEFLSTDLRDAIGLPLSQVVPEMAPLLVRAGKRSSGAVEAQLIVERDGRARSLRVRIVSDIAGGRRVGYVVTLDDVTELLSAQRKAAWSDIARRIAHEIKNPLTPIQLSAERLRRKYLSQITQDPENFSMCTDTIVRQVGDIGRMIDEFSNFARMPAPQMSHGDLMQICQQAVALQQAAHPELVVELPQPDVQTEINCDSRQVGQALTNLLQNAVEAIEGREGDAAKEPGLIRIEILPWAKGIEVVVTDNGRGLPESDRDRLTEPYVTTRERGTGLGLAIVRKIMEDHGGELDIRDAEGGGARVSLRFGPDGGDADRGWVDKGKGEAA